MPYYRKIRSDPLLDPKFPEKSDPDPKETNFGSTTLILFFLFAGGLVDSWPDNALRHIAADLHAKSIPKLTKKQSLKKFSRRFLIGSQKSSKCSKFFVNCACFCKFLRSPQNVQNFLFIVCVFVKLFSSYLVLLTCSFLLRCGFIAVT